MTISRQHAFGSRIALVAVLALSGCVQLPGISLKQAMVEEADALAAGQRQAAKNGITGFQPCDVTVIFGITSAQGGTLGVTAAKIAPLINFGASKSESLENTVTIDYKSQACIDMEKAKPMTSSKQ